MPLEYAIGFGQRAKRQERMFVAGDSCITGAVADVVAVGRISDDQIDAVGGQLFEYR